MKPYIYDARIGAAEEGAEKVERQIRRGILNAAKEMSHPNVAKSRSLATLVMTTWEITYAVGDEAGEEWQEILGLSARLNSAPDARRHEIEFFSSF